MICKYQAVFVTYIKDVFRTRIFILLTLILFFLLSVVFDLYAWQDTETGKAHYDAGITLLNQGRYEDALTEFESSLQQNEDVLDTHLHLAHLYQFVRDDRSKAQYHYNSYMAILRSLDDSDKMVVSSSISAQHEKASELFQDALTFMQAGDNGRARDLLLEAVALHPYDPMMQYNLGIASHRLGLYGDAIQYYRKAAQFFRESEGILFSLGTAYQQNGDEHAAVETYRKVLALNPRHVQALNNCAVLLERAGMYDEAAAYYESIIAIDPQYVRAYNNLAVLYALKNDTEKARDLLKNAIAVQPGYLDAHFNLGKVYENREDIESALEEYRFVALHDASYPDVIKRISDLEAQQTENSSNGNKALLLSSSVTHPALQDAVAQTDIETDAEALRLKKEIETHPEDTALYLKLADYYCGRNKYEDALAVLDTAVTNQSQSNDIRLARAGLLVKQKLFYRAIMEYEDILAETPDCIEAHYRLSLLYIQDDNPLRDSRKAMLHYKKFQDLGGEDSSEQITF